MHPISRPSVLCRAGQIDLNQGPHFYTPAIGPHPFGGAEPGAALVPQLPLVGVNVR